MVLRSIGVLSAGKVLGITYALLGLIFGGFFALASMLGGAANMAQNGDGAIPFVGFGAAAIVIMPIMYGIVGFIGGVITAAIYNVVAVMVGGIELDFAGRADVASPM